MLKDLWWMGKVAGLQQLFQFAKSKKQNLNHVRGYFVSSCICALLKTPFFDHLSADGQVHIGKFCSKYDYDQNYLTHICRYLAALSLLELEGDLCTLNKKLCLEPSVGVYQFINAYGPVFANLHALLTKKENYGERIHRDERYVAIAADLTERLVPYPYLKKLIQKMQCTSLVDLGCGNAAFLIYLSDGLSGKSYGIDISQEAIQEAVKNVADHNLNGKIALICADVAALPNIPIETMPDTITALYVLHEFITQDRPIDKLLEVLRNIRRTFPRSKLIVLETCQYSPAELQKSESLIAEHHLFHGCSLQNILPFDAWKEVFSKAGYHILMAEEIKMIGMGSFVLQPE